MADSDSSLYDRDFALWAKENAALLRSGRVNEADLAHIAEEIEDLGKSQYRELRSRVRVILQHLLRIQYSDSPSERSQRSWLATLDVQRDELEEVLEENPSLRSKIAPAILRAYPLARKLASGETGLPIDTFPASSPYNADQVTNNTFVPN